MDCKGKCNNDNRKNILLFHLYSWVAQVGPAQVVVDPALRLRRQLVVKVIAPSARFACNFFINSLHYAIE